MHAIMHHASLPPPDPSAPGMFRCAAPGFIAGFLREAGLRDTVEKEVTGKVSFDSPSHYWAMMMEVAAPVVSAMSKLDEATRDKIKARCLCPAASSAPDDGRVTLLRLQRPRYFRAAK